MLGFSYWELVSFLGAFVVVSIMLLLLLKPKKKKLPKRKVKKECLLLKQIEKVKGDTLEDLYKNIELQKEERGNSYASLYLYAAIYLKHKEESEFDQMNDIILKIRKENPDFLLHSFFIKNKISVKTDLKIEID